MKRTLKKRSKVLEAGKRERYDGSDCAQQLTPYAEDSAGYTVVYAPEYLVVEVDGGTLLCRESTSVRRQWRKIVGRWVALSGVTVITGCCIHWPGLWKKTRASARKLVDPGGWKYASACRSYF